MLIVVMLLVVVLTVVYAKCRIFNSGVSVVMLNAGLANVVAPYLLPSIIHNLISSRLFIEKIVYHFFPFEYR